MTFRQNFRLQLGHVAILCGLSVLSAGMAAGEDAGMSQPLRVGKVRLHVEEIFLPFETITAS